VTRHECNSLCNPPVHLDIAFIQQPLSIACFEAALQEVVGTCIRIRAIREVAEYNIPEGLRWLDGPHADELLRDFPPTNAYLVEYTFL